MKLNLGKIILSHLEHIVGVGEEHISAFFIYGHKLMLTLFECVKSLLIITFNPACFIQRYWLPSALCAILMQESVLYDFKLKLTHGTNKFTTIELVDKQLSHALVHKLLNTFFKLL